MHDYFYHLYKNWCVAFHALTDFFAHLIHGILPFIKIKHHQPVLKVCTQDVEKDVRYTNGLKDCPFCSGTPMYDENFDNGCVYGFIYCISCKIRTPKFSFRSYEQRREAATKLWNRRCE